MIGDGLVLRDVSKRFGAYWALRDVRAIVPSGSITAFIGPNGAGKTTLLHVIGGTLSPDTGSIIFRGQSIGGRPAYAVASAGIGRQFQDVRAFGSMTALDNVAVAALPRSAQESWKWLRRADRHNARREAKKSALRWLDYVGMARHACTIAATLSFGQQKLVSLARLFAQRARLLLLDEPTAGLSPAMVERVVRTIKDAVTDLRISVVIVEHDMHVVADAASWIHFMHEGRIAFSGATAHVLGNEVVRRLYVGL